MASVVIIRQAHTNFNESCCITTTISSEPGQHETNNMNDGLKYLTNRVEEYLKNGYTIKEISHSSSMIINNNVKDITIYHLIKEEE